MQLLYNLSDLVVYSVNAVYDKIDCNDSIAEELHAFFSYKYPNYETLKYKVKRFKYWDGIVHLFTKKGHKIYAGLRKELAAYCKDHNLTIEYADPWLAENFSLHEAEEYIKSLNIPEEIISREYQMNAFLHIIRNGRSLVLSATSSGKSYMIYLICMYWNVKTLIIVPSLGLVKQMSGDFKSYGYKEDIHHIYAGQSKHTDNKVTVATWQSLQNIPDDDLEDYMNQFGAIIVDEAHEAQAAEIKRLMEHATNVSKRIGFTGTIDDESPTHIFVLQGLFGPFYTAIKTHELIEQGYAAQLNIKCLILHYPEEYCKAQHKMDFAEEREYVLNLENRQNYINNLILSLKGNTMVLFQLVEKHGKILYDDIKRLAKDRPVYFVYGGVNADIREEIRSLLGTHDDAILIASYGTLSRGYNAPSIQNVIFASPYKSKIKVLQSIGRGLRLYKGTVCTVLDIIDNLTYKNDQNYFLQHSIKRIKLYIMEKLKYKIYQIKLKG